MIDKTNYGQVLQYTSKEMLYSLDNFSLRKSITLTRFVWHVASA